MTLSAYLGLLSLGSTIQTRSSAENQHEEEHELNALRRMAQSIARAEIDTVSTVSVHNAPSERKSIRIYIHYFLFVSTFVTWTNKKKL